MTQQLKATGNREYLKAEKVIELAHGRGKSELTNRSFKEFIGREQLPFKNFGMNGAYYYMLVIAHFLYESYKEDVSRDVVPVNSYATTFRRTLIDFAATDRQEGESNHAAGFSGDRGYVQGRGTLEPQQWSCSITRSIVFATIICLR